MSKIAFIGAGSVVFTKNLLADIFTFPELRGSTIALHDIDPERLETAAMMARWRPPSNSARTRRWRITSTGAVPWNGRTS